MELSSRALWTMIHGMGFGALYLMAFSGAFLALWRQTSSQAADAPNPSHHRQLSSWLTAMALLAWLAVLSGTYIVYPWYRALPPPGTASLAAFPQRLLLSSPQTSQWHTLGMEWKEFVAWLVPISITMVAAVYRHYGPALARHQALRNAILGFAAASFLTAGIAGFWGAMLNKAAPVEGGSTLHILGAESR